MHAGPVFVGRQRELAELRAGLEDAVGGRGRFFLVVGEAGIGKTRLAEELAREAAERGGVALWGRCWEGEGAPPYWPWVQVIRALLQGVPAEELRPAVGAGAPYLVPLVPELGERFRDLPALSTSPRSEHARFYLFDAVATLLRSAAQRTPLVLVLDDLQWADAPSLLLLQFLAHELRDVRILLLGTYREVEVRQAPAVAEILGALGRDGHHVQLRGLDPEALLETLGPALAREIVVREPGGVGRYRFAHALIRETLYEELGPAERIRLHGQIGEVLEEVHRTDPTPHLTALAHHFLEAAPARGADKALVYSTRAGRHAAASLAYEAAAAHFQSALEVLGLARPGDERERCKLLLARGDVQWKSGDGRGARETFQQAAEIARRIGDAPLLARSAPGFAGEGSRLLWVRSEVVDQPRIELLEEALHRLGDGDPGLRAQLLARLALNLYWAPEPERVVALSEEAVRLARQLGDPRLLAAVLRARWIALWRPEGAAERLAIADEILHLGERTGDRELALLGHRFRIVGFLEHGDVVATDREIEAWAQIAGELRQPLYLTDLAMWRATRAIMDGRFADGEEQAQRAVELGQREPDVQPILRHEIQTFLLHFHKGCLDQLVGRSQPRTGVPATMFQRCARAFVWSETGRQAEARRELSALAKEGIPLPRDGAWVVSMSLLSAVAAELNDRTSAAQLYELLMPYAGRVGIFAAGLACWGSVSYHLGLLASTLGRVADAIRHYEDAATVHERMGARPFLAWTQLAHARLLLTRDAGARRGEAAAF